MATFLLSSILALCASAASAQQFGPDGEIPNSLFNYGGSEITTFRIADPSGAGKPLDLINYYSLSTDGSRLETSAIQRLVIMLFGAGRDAWNYQHYIQTSLQTLPAGTATLDNTALLTPMFANQMDNGTAYPWDATTSTSTSNALVWQDDTWAYGQNSIYPANATKISGFYVLDQVVEYYQNATLFPNLKQIIIAGHSKGAQMCQRYAALSSVGLNDDAPVPVTFWPANPNSFVWLSTNRPVENNCSEFDDWFNGLSNYATADQTYAADFVAKGGSTVLQNFQSKQIAWLRSTGDDGDESVGCAPYSQGANRDERFRNFIAEFLPTCDSATGGNCDTVDYVAGGHDAPVAINSTAGLARLFQDNFDGKGERAYDSGTRRQEGDDPYPAPS